MSNQVVKLNRGAVSPCMTCLLCHKIFRHATTIIECLHTFCRKCIYKKLSDEEMECCPICNIHLGCAPLEKLRVDHNLQDVRAKIFPYKRRKVEAPEVVTPVTLPAKRKERSLSSLVSTPRVSTHSGMTGRRSKSVARKASRGSIFIIEKSPKKGEVPVEDHPESSSAPSTLNKFPQSTRLNSTAAKPSVHPSPDRGRENCSVPGDGKVELWKPLNCLVEAVNTSKSSTLTSQVSVAQSEALQLHYNEGLLCTTKDEEHANILKVQDEKKGSNNPPQEQDEPKKLLKIRQKKTHKFGEFRVPQAVLDATSAKWEIRNDPIWFSLVASDDQKGDALLPQISASYLRIKDGNIPVSFIQKYLKKKLNLTSEDEVQIKCMGHPVIPSLTLKNLVDLWLQTTTQERVSARIGSSAKDFVMVLGYARKIRSP